jgi:hypothetical protein
MRIAEVGISEDSSFYDCVVAICKAATSPSISEYLSAIARQFLPAALNSAIATSPAASFSGAYFCDGATFAGSTFFESGNAFFMDATFERTTGFEHARFMGATDFVGVGSMGRFVSFEGARFESTVDFSGRKFGNETSFRYTHFGDLAKFYDVEFPADTDFTRADFRGSSASLLFLLSHCIVGFASRTTRLLLDSLPTQPPTCAC